MSGTVEQLTQQLAVLDQQAEELEASLRTTYGSYLNALAKTLRQQLILASYYICTEGYPEDFLKLPLSQRYDLQTKLKAIAQDTRRALESLLIDPQPSPSFPSSFSMGSGNFFPGHAIVAAFEMPPNAIAINGSVEGEPHEDGTDILEIESLNDLESTLEQIQDQMKLGIFDSSLDDEEEEEDDDDDEEEEDDDDDDDNNSSDRSNPNDRRRNNSRRGMTESNARELQAILAQVAAAISAKEPKTPIDRLTTWQENIERGIQEKICMSSYKTNQALKKSTLIPEQVPDRALEAASRVDNDANSPVSHVVQMLVEMGNRRPSDPESDDHASDPPKRANADPFGPNVPKLIHVVALQLRLGELEFNDPILMRWRNRLRELANNTQDLTRKYRKCQHKRSVAEAQDAWRSSWTSEE